MENVIGGKLNYLRMVKGDHNAAYQKLQRRFDALQQGVYVDKETDEGTQYIYVQPYTLSDFEDLFQTKISLEINEKNKIVGKCSIGQIEKYLSISKSTQSYIRAKLEKMNLEDIVGSQFFKSFHVTLCRQKGKNFWLITQFEPKRSTCLSLQDAQIDIDALLSIWENKGIEKVANAFCTYHRPAEVSRFLLKFSGDDCLKYTTHVWDTEKITDFESFSKDYYEVVRNISSLST